MITQNVKAKSKAKPSGEPREVPIDKIDLHGLNPRGTLDPMDIERLAASLDREGLLQRPIVRPKAGGRYELIAGSRRYHAARAAGWQSLPVEVRDVGDADAAQYLVVENLLRKNLNPIEKAKAVKLLLTPAAEGGAGSTTNEVAAMLGKSADAVNKQLRLLKLPEPWRSRVAEGKIDSQSGIVLAPYVDQPHILAAIDDDLRRNPELWEGQHNFRKRVVLIAEKLGALTNRVKRAELVERAGDATGTVHSLSKVAKHFRVNKNTVLQWKAAGAPLNEAPYDLAAIAAWLKQRQERDNADRGRGSRPTALTPTRRAAVVQLDNFRSAPKMRARPQLLTESQAIDLLSPYMHSLGDLELLLAHVQAMIADVKREAAAKN